MLRAHLSTRGNEMVVPTERLIKHWLGRLNHELFGGELPMPTGIRLKVQRGWMACAHLEYDRSGWYLDFIEMPMPRKHFLEILAHEMVHAVVHLIDRQSIATMHGPAFMAYRSKLEYHGLPLKDGFYG